MRVAALYDIHGNLPALEAALEEMARCGVDLVVIGGDVMPGPMPRGTLDRLLQLGIPTRFLHGNGEVAVLEHLAGKVPSAVPEQVRPAITWTSGQLAPQHVKIVEAWPKELRLTIPGLGDVLFCHATPRSVTEIFTFRTPEKVLLPVFAGINSPVVVCGHTHMQFDRKVGAVRVVNAGSIGMPFGRPGAYWLLLGPDVRLRHTLYDFEEAAARIRQSGYPQAETFAARSILQPPSEEEMLEVFEKAVLK